MPSLRLLQNPLRALAAAAMAVALACGGGGGGGTTGGGGTGPVTPPAASLEQLSVWDAVYSPATGRLCVAVSAQSAVHPKALAIVDPATGAVEKTLDLGTEVRRLTLAGDGRTLYAVNETLNRIERLDLATFSRGSGFPVAVAGGSTGRTVSSIAAVPGDASQVAVATSDGMLTLFSNGAPLQDALQVNGRILAGPVPGTLRVLDVSSSAAEITPVTVTSTGLRAETPWPGAAVVLGGAVQAAGKVYFRNGQVMDALTGDLAGRFILPDNPYAADAVLPDPAGGRVFFAAGTKVLVFDAATWAQTGVLNRLPGGRVDGMQLTPGGKLALTLDDYGSGSAQIRFLATTLPRISRFEPAASRIAKGATTTLNWEVTGGGTASIEGLPPLTGTSISIAPTVTTRYELRVTSSAGYARAAATVAVDPGRGAFTLLKGAKDIVYSPATRRLYASLPASAGASGNALAVVDPATGAVTDSIPLGSDPGKLAISDDGLTLYAILDGAAALRRVDLTAGKATATYVPGFEPGWWGAGRRFPQAIAVLPGQPGSLAVVTGRASTDSWQDLAVFDEGVRRPGFVTYGADAPDSLAGFDGGSRLYGYTFNTLQPFDVAPDGIKAAFPSLDADSPVYYRNETWAIREGRAYAATGEVMDPATGSRLPGFQAYGSTVEPDLASGRVYFGYTGGIGAYDTATGRLAAWIATGITPSRIVACGGGVIAALGDGDLVLARSELPAITAFSATPDVLGQGQEATLSWAVTGADTLQIDDATVSGTSLKVNAAKSHTYVLKATNAWGSVSAEARVTALPASGPLAVDIAANHLAYSPATGRLYLSIPDWAGILGNQIAVVDPATGRIERALPGGPSPTRLALSVDGTALHVVLYGQGAIRTLDLATGASLRLFPFGYDRGFSVATDIKGLPDGRESILVAPARSSMAGPMPKPVRAFDAGVPRAFPANPDFFDGGSTCIEIGDQPGVAFGLDGSTTGTSYQNLTVDGTGVSASAPRLNAFSSPYPRMVHQKGRLFLTSGDILEAGTGRHMGQLDAQGPVVPDLDAGIVYMGGQNRIERFDAVTGRPMGALALEITPNALVRWGQDGLAAIGDGKLVLARTTLPAISRFSADRLNVKSGTPVHLTWTVTGADTLSLSTVGAVAGEGCTVVPTSTTTNREDRTFVLTATNASGSVTAEVSLRIEPGIRLDDAGLKVADLAWNPLTGRLYAALPAKGYGGGASIAVIDPATGNIESRLDAGGDPVRIALADDQRTLWISRSDSGTVASLDLPTGVLSPGFRLPWPAGEPQHIAWAMEPLPGRPRSLALISYGFGIHMPDQVAVYDDGVLRATLAMPPDVYVMPSLRALQVAPAGDRVYLFNNDGSGYDYVTASLGPASFATDRILKPEGMGSYLRMQLEGGKLWFTNGTVLDPESGARLASLALSGASLTAAIPDTASGYHYACANKELVRFDAATLAFAGRIPLGFTPGRILRFGSRGLALVDAETGLLYLLPEPAFSMP